MKKNVLILSVIIGLFLASPMTQTVEAESSVSKDSNATIGFYYPEEKETSGNNQATEGNATNYEQKDTAGGSSKYLPNTGETLHSEFTIIGSVLIFSALAYYIFKRKIEGEKD